MFRRMLSLAAVAGLVGVPAQAQVQHHTVTGSTTPANHGNPLFFNNPLNQAGAYATDPVLQFNNPTNQTGMYLNDPVLRFNNPLNQAGMYMNDPVLRYNDPLNQDGMYLNDPVLRFNNPLYQGGPVGSGPVNTPIAQGGITPTGPNTNGTTGLGNFGTLTGLNQGLGTGFGGGLANFGGFGSQPVVGNAFGFGGYPAPFAVSGSYTGVPGGWGWNTYSPGNWNMTGGFSNGAVVDAPLPNAAPVLPAQAARRNVSGQRRENSQASAILNGALPNRPTPSSAKSANSAARRKAANRRR